MHGASIKDGRENVKDLQGHLTGGSSKTLLVEKKEFFHENAEKSGKTSNAKNVARLGGGGDRKRSHYLPHDPDSGGHVFEVSTPKKGFHSAGEYQEGTPLKITESKKRKR